MSEIEPGSDRDKADPQIPSSPSPSPSPSPALEPFETLYGTADQVVVEQNLPTKVNPVMLDGIWKKRPQPSLKATCREYLCHFGNAVKIGGRRLLDRIRHFD